MATLTVTIYLFVTVRTITSPWTPACDVEPHVRSVHQRRCDGTQRNASLQKEVCHHSAVQTHLKSPVQKRRTYFSRKTKTSTLFHCCLQVKLIKMESVSRISDIRKTFTRVIFLHVSVRVICPMPVDAALCLCWTCFLITYCVVIIQFPVLSLYSWYATDWYR